MKKILLIVLTLVLVPMHFAADVTSRTVDGSVRILPERADVADMEMPQATGRQLVLFVQDPGNVAGPGFPDQWWVATLDSLIPGDYTLWGPTTTETEPGPDAATMGPYVLVIWDTYDYWNPALGPAITATDQTEIDTYLAAGGKMWLIGQDILWSGTPMPWMLANFDLSSASQDYGGGFPSGWFWFNGLVEIAADTFQTMDDWGSDFFPDHLVPTDSAHQILQDQAMPTMYPAILRNNYTTSFWTVDGRQPDPWEDWQDIVYTMFTLFDVIQPPYDDVGPISIDIASFVPPDTSFPPQATITNYGTDNETFDVTCDINGFSSTFNVVDLAPAETLQVTFTDTFTFAPDTYTVTVYTELGSDENTSNDTLEMEVISTGIAEWGNKPTKFMFSAPAISREGKVNVEIRLPDAAHVDLSVYSAIGTLYETVISDRLSAGTHTLSNDIDLPTGVYFFNLKTAGIDATKKVLVVK